MKKIAIIKVYGAYQYDHYGDLEGYAQITQHVTDWEEVSDDDFNMLYRGISQLTTGDSRYILIEKVENTRAVVNKTVSDYKKFLQKLEDDRLRYEAEALRKREEAKRKKEEKAKMTKEQKLKKLAEELGVQIEVKS